LTDFTSGTDVALDPTVFVFGATDLSTLTTDHLKIKSYNLKATAILTGYPSITSTI
jgi:hypothetical protein